MATPTPISFDEAFSSALEDSDVIAFAAASGMDLHCAKLRSRMKLALEQRLAFRALSAQAQDDIKPQEAMSVARPPKALAHVNAYQTMARLG